MIAAATGDIPAYWLWAFPLLVIGVLATFFWNSLLTFFIYLLNKADRRNEISKATIERMADQIITARFQSLANEVAAFRETVSHLRGVVEKTEAEFDLVWDGEREMETKITDKLHSLKVDTMKEFHAALHSLATRDDLDRLRKEIRDK